VRRVPPWKDGRSPSANPVYAERTGRLTVPLLTLHETGDAWVPLSLEQSYRRGRSRPDGPAARAARGAGAQSLQRRSSGPPAGVRRIVASIERGVRPDGEDVLAADLSRIGLKWTPVLHPEDPLAR
jgi:hypothetical protein